MCGDEGAAGVEPIVSNDMNWAHESLRKIYERKADVLPELKN
jgi:hypothetical protein